MSANKHQCRLQKEQKQQATSEVGLGVEKVAQQQAKRLQLKAAIVRRKSA